MTNHPCSRMTLAALAALATFAAVGCSSPSSALEGDLLIEEADNLAAHDGEDIHLLVQVSDLEAYPAALYQSGLEVDAAGCVRLAESTEPVTVLWPKGFSGRKSGGEIEILDAGGIVVARTGEDVRLGGGGLPFLHEGIGFTEADQALAVSRCPGEFWLVSPGSVEIGS